MAFGTSSCCDECFGHNLDGNQLGFEISLPASQLRYTMELNTAWRGFRIACKAREIMNSYIHSQKMKNKKVKKQWWGGRLYVCSKDHLNINIFPREKNTHKLCKEHCRKYVTSKRPLYRITMVKSQTKGTSEYILDMPKELSCSTVGICWRHSEIPQLVK